MTPEALEALSKQGILLWPSISPEHIFQLAQKLSPQKTQYDLVRLGPRYDGGYLVPDDLDGITACFSPGVSNYAYFEDDLAKKYGIRSYQADYSVSGPPEGFSPLSFMKKFIGAHNDKIYMTLENWVKSCWEYDLPGDFILQMDIEGGEYASLLATPDIILKRFRIIVLEMHALRSWMHAPFYLIANALVDKLRQHFVVVHNHPNNHGAIVNINGFDIPELIEVTMLRKDRCKSIQNCTEFPHHLDAPCASHLPETILPTGFR